MFHLHQALRGCELRLQRARRYVEEAETLLGDFAREAERRIVESYDEATGRYLPLQLPDAPVFLPLAISDAVHNFRSALDYLVYELAKEDSGTEQEGTQFPITSAPNGFVSVADRYLRGVSAEHRAAIEKLQPYNGVEWTALLRDISNADKHRRLTVVVREDFVTGMSSESGRRTTLPTGQTLEIDPHQSIMIDLPQGKQFVMVTLDTIEGMVHETLGRFDKMLRTT